jgi:hypothetical protein
MHAVLSLTSLFHDFNLEPPDSFALLTGLFGLMLAYLPEFTGPRQLILVTRLLILKSQVVPHPVIEDRPQLLPPRRPLLYLISQPCYLRIPLSYYRLLLIYLCLQFTVVTLILIDYIGGFSYLLG